MAALSNLIWSTVCDRVIYLGKIARDEIESVVVDVPVDGRLVEDHLVS